jgi:hypothetical protein
MLRLSGYYLGFLFRHYHSQISFQRPAVSWEFHAFFGSSRHMVGQCLMVGYMCIIQFFDFLNGSP